MTMKERIPVLRRAAELIDERGSGTLTYTEFVESLLAEFPDKVGMYEGLTLPMTEKKLGWGPDTCTVQYSLGWVCRDGLLYDDKVVAADGRLIDFRRRRWWDLVEA
jgi:hypothetical protein